MSIISPTRRELLAATTAAVALSLLPGALRAAAGEGSIRPFTVNIPEDEITELRRRIAATRWPDRETVDDQSQGIQLAKLQAARRILGQRLRLAQGGGEAQRPAAIRHRNRRRRHPFHPCSLEASHCLADDHHSWLAGLVFEQLESSVRSPIQPLMADAPKTHSTSSFRRCRAMAFPASPPARVGDPPHRPGWAQLMRRLGYTDYVAQGGDWGSPVSSAMARQAPAGLLGIHINLPAIVPPEIAAVLAAGGPAPPDSPTRSAPPSMRSARPPG